MELCERFKEFRERGRCVVYFPNVHEGEDPDAYGIFLSLMRLKMGLMVLAPDREARFEPVYRDALKYHLQTIRHSRLFTSFVPIKTRVYFVETAAVSNAFYPCADFCIPGGTLRGGAVDLATPIAARCPVILGPQMPDNEWRSGLLDVGGAVWAKDQEETVQLAKAWLDDPQAARAAAEKAYAWWQGRSA